MIKVELSCRAKRLADSEQFERMKNFVYKVNIQIIEGGGSGNTSFKCTLLAENTHESVQQV